MSILVFKEKAEIEQLLQEAVEICKLITSDMFYIQAYAEQIQQIARNFLEKASTYE